MVDHPPCKPEPMAKQGVVRPWPFEKMLIGYVVDRFGQEEAEPEERTRARLHQLVRARYWWLWFHLFAFSLVIWGGIWAALTVPIVHLIEAKRPLLCFLFVGLFWMHVVILPVSGWFDRRFCAGWVLGLRRRCDGDCV